MMDTKRILDAVVEAQNFIDRARVLIEARKTEPDWLHPKQSGAVRRASMDLTRALAEMRRRSK